MRYTEKNVNYQLGQWCKEKDLIAFKAIGIKWYITIDEDDKVDIKAAGANKWLMKEWCELNENSLKGKVLGSKTPLMEFNRDMKISGMFTRWGKAKGNTIYCRKDNFLSEEDKKSISGHFTNLYYYEYQPVSEEAV